MDMALVHELERSGNWLFKRRSWLPVFLIIAGIAVMYFNDESRMAYNLKWEMICLAISLFGEYIRIATVSHVHGKTSGRNTSKGQVAETINTTGLYSLIRHPLYVGNFFMWLGPVVFLRSGWFVVVFFLSYWIYYERIMFAEEQFLRGKFGEAYDEWAEKVGAVLPKSMKYVKPSLPFSMKTVLKREYNSFFNVFVIFSCLDVFRNFFLTKEISISSIWLWLLIGSAVIWIVVRTLNKKSNLLEVEGR